MQGEGFAFFRWCSLKRDAMARFVMVLASPEGQRATRELLEASVWPERAVLNTDGQEGPTP